MAAGLAALPDTAGRSVAPAAALPCAADILGGPRQVAEALGARFDLTIASLNHALPPLPLAVPYPNHLLDLRPAAR